MTEKLKQTIKEEIGKLPKEAQDAINALDWEKIAEDIGKKCFFDEGKINDLQLETLLVLVGLEDAEFYSNNIIDNVGTTMDEGKKIAEEVLQKIFTPIGNEITKNIKSNLKNKNPSVEQTLNFILSGGDYGALIAPNSPLEEYPLGGSGRIPPSPLQGEGRGEVYPPRSDFGRSTPQEGNKNSLKKNIPISPRRMTDLKSQFKI